MAPTPSSSTLSSRSVRRLASAPRARPFTPLFLFPRPDSYLTLTVSPSRARSPYLVAGAAATQDKLEAFRKMIQTPDELTWKILGLYFLGQFVIMAVVPGKKFEGPLSPMGNRPVYKAHGLQCYFLNLALYAILYTQGVFTGTMIYEQMGKIYTALVIVAFVLCFFLWIKGHVAPTYVGSRQSGAQATGIGPSWAQGLARAGPKQSQAPNPQGTGIGQGRAGQGLSNGKGDDRALTPPFSRTRPHPTLFLPQSPPPPHPFPALAPTPPFSRPSPRPHPTLFPHSPPPHPLPARAPTLTRNPPSSRPTSQRQRLGLVGQPDHGLLLGHGVVPAHLWLRHQALHQLPRQHDCVAAPAHQLRHGGGQRARHPRAER